MSVQTAGSAPNRTAEAIFARYPIPASARTHLKPGQSCGAFFNAAMAARDYNAAVFFASAVLTKRDAVAWAVQCAESIASAADAPAVREALAAARKWSQNPTDENRRACQTQADAVGLEHPAGIIAFAAFTSGGSLAPAAVQDPVPPAEHLTAQLVANGLALASVLTQPETANDKLGAFLALLPPCPALQDTL